MSAAGARTDPHLATGMANAHLVRMSVPGVVQSLDLRMAAGEAIAVIGLGPAGNTRLLRALAGLDPGSGPVAVGGESVHDPAAGMRPAAMVFRDLALYPHLDVEGNIAFPLRHRPPPDESDLSTTDDPRDRIEDVATQLQLLGLLESMPAELTPAQRVRVALARAVAWQPRLLLVDDVLSALPSLERLELRALMRRLQRAWRVPTIYAVSDSSDAMALGDRIAVIADGALLQADTPSILYANPATVAVARALGMPPINLLEAQLDGAQLQIGGQRVDGIAAARDPVADRDVLVGIRPEGFEAAAAHKNAIVAVLEPDSREMQGSHTIVRGRIEDQPVLVSMPGDPADLPPRVCARPSDLLLFDRRSGERLR